MKEGFHFKHYDVFMKPEVHKSMKETSIDDWDPKHPYYLSGIKTKVIDFDEVKKCYLRDNGMLEDNAKSVDALYMSNNKICLTEFKNGDFRSSEIIEKALSSAMIFMDITGYTLKDFRKDSVFLLVYNPEEKGVDKRQISAAYKARRSKRRYSKFDLYHLWDFCFGEVLEIEKDEFDSSVYAKGIEGY